MSCAARELVFAHVARRGSRAPGGGRASKADPSSQGSRRERNGSVALASSNGEGSLALVLSPDANEYYREVRGEEDGDERFLDAAPCDFFELLGVDTDASADDVKQAFRKLQRVAHPTSRARRPSRSPCSQLRVRNPLRRFGARGDQKTVELARRAFVGGSQFDGRPVSEWAGPRDEARAIFVDESTCIGCKSCVLHAPNTFEMVEDFNAGRARCVRQWGDDEETMQVAIELCPVDCIYWVKRNQLPILEYAMKAASARTSPSWRDDEAATWARHPRTEPLHECGENAPPPKGGARRTSTGGDRAAPRRRGLSRTRRKVERSHRGGVVGAPEERAREGMAGVGRRCGRVRDTGARHSGVRGVRGVLRRVECRARSTPAVPVFAQRRRGGDREPGESSPVRLRRAMRGTIHARRDATARAVSGEMGVRVTRDRRGRDRREERAAPAAKLGRKTRHRPRRDQPS